MVFPFENCFSVVIPFLSLHEENIENCIGLEKKYSNLSIFYGQNGGASTVKKKSPRAAYNTVVVGTCTNILPSVPFYCGHRLSYKI